MPSPLGTRLLRAFFVFLVCAQSLLLIPQAASSAPLNEVIVHFDVIAVVRDESVTIRTRDFPVRTKFTARIDVVGKWAIGGTIVGELDTAQGGVLEATFPLPEAVQGKRILAIRLESADNYSADNWFFNRTQTSPLLSSVKPPVNQPVKEPEINFSDVKKNESVTLEASNLPPNTSFGVRIGPFENFYLKYTTLEPVTSTANGTLKTTLQIPPVFKDVEHVMVRLDGGGKSAYRIFANTNGGKAVSEQSIIKVVPCSVVAISNVPSSLAPGEDFDVVWTVQNTAWWNWKADGINYRFNGGEKMHKYKDLYGIKPEIKRGESFEIALDMLAPKEPGWHHTQWALVVEDTENIYCKLDLTVFVHE